MTEFGETAGRHRERSNTGSIVVRLRWFGILMGYTLVQTRVGLRNPSAVRAYLALGAGYAALDTAFYRLGDPILTRIPLVVSFLESVFIALLCYHDTGLESPFRWYYLLSVVCTAIQYRHSVAWLTCGFHCASFAILSNVTGLASAGFTPVAHMMILLAWTTWACSSLAGMLRVASDRLEAANADLERSRRELERRVEERSEALRASQARVIQQEKMAAFGLLAAGIAHEVGNPLASISSLIQMLRRRNPEPYASEKLELAERQLERIGRTIRELVDFSRPASSLVVKVRPIEAVEEALGIAKYYQRTKEREISTDVTPDLPAVRGIRDHITQVLLNLTLNAIDATPKGGRIRIGASLDGRWVEIRVEDEGRGITIADRCRIFQPYFTTKPQGTGLGLFVSRQIVEELGGRLSFRSEVGEGTTFVVRLPAEPSEASRVAPEFETETSR